MSGQKRSIHGLFTEPFSGETVRAFLVFTLLFLALTGMASQLLFRELSLQVLARRVNLGSDEAARIAQAVASLGRDRGGINFRQIRQKKAVLRTIVEERIAGRPYLRYVEVRDRFGGRLFYHSRDTLEVSVPGLRDEEPGGSQVVTAPLMPGPDPGGEVRVGISNEQIQLELQELGSSLRLKLILAACFGIGVLIVGFFYVLHLIRKNRRLEQSRLSAERRSYVGLLASGLAHEIRNPLNAMNMNLQMLEEELQAGAGLEQEECRELLTSTKREIKRLERLANNFLAYARPAHPRFERRDLNEVLREIAHFLQADFRQNGVHLKIDLEPLLPTVELDETLFKQAIMNLLVNARQVLPPEGTAWLVSRAGPDGEAMVEVKDNGPGIPPETQEKIFEVFFSSRGGGTGLGLPIARQIVERHGGSIEVESTRGRGTTFRIHLPRRHRERSSVTEAAPVTP